MKVQISLDLSVKDIQTFGSFNLLGMPVANIFLDDVQLLPATQSRNHLITQERKILMG
jgi:hypothetical protein